MPATKKEIKQYTEYVKNIEPKTKWFPSLIWAFLIGGLICAFGESIGLLAKHLWASLDQKQIGAIVSSTLVFLASFLTGIGVFDKIGKVAGAGTIIPITGFSNSITSPAVEFKSEGLIFGTSSKMFVVAGPVIVNGLVVSFVIGLIYLIFSI